MRLKVGLWFGLVLNGRLYKIVKVSIDDGKNGKKEWQDGKIMVRKNGTWRQAMSASVLKRSASSRFVADSALLCLTMKPNLEECARF